jgi:hypothetical protein
MGRFNVHRRLVELEGNAAFGVSALSDDTVVGEATIRYRLFPF